MPRPSYKGVLNLNEPSIKQRLMSFVGKLTDFYEIDIKPRRSTRSLKQNAWYWACLVQPFYEFLKEQDYEITENDAHEILRMRFVGNKTIPNKKTGEVLVEHRISTTELTTEQFSDYCEKCRDFLAQYIKYIAPDPDPSHAISH